MTTILYTTKEGGYWKSKEFKDHSVDDLKKICESQRLPKVDLKDLQYKEGYHKVILPGDFEVYAVMFKDGSVWDSLTSEYDNVGEKAYQALMNGGV